MQLKPVLLILSLAACEKYTDATSPCFGKDGKPAVTRGSTSYLSFAAFPAKDCSFVEIEGLQ
ncbi:hypothetical protein [Ruegeria sp. Ofav3-42]|uniref:hypothetical protein n=1 Tax=Ruegeria sp. Ofav3-42 TaxID=2917759 RepID=UPI001EF41B6D|nr:hypothetical protein [Ruegeria sp. Ofav3-42]MCG7521907.1 hypothetical protein [Ruegeria sp. Ofav3-42]